MFKLKFRALKKNERMKKLRELLEKIRREMKEKYKFCNLYVKGLPDNITEDEFRKIF
jgi:RNA recognition motif-containing protein